jgi:hypothetical protein
VASQGYSVLYLFLVADLVCTGAVFPTFYGLYSSRLGGGGAFLSALAGIAGGALFFPDPSFARGNLLISFLVALIIPVCITLILSRAWKEAAPDIDNLAGKIRDIRV